jgi:hypothetical protein
MIDSIALDLLKVLKKILNKRCMLLTFNKGVIIFIPRFGDKFKIGNWHPITLLSNVYKVMAKVLTWRLQEFLP